MFCGHTQKTPQCNIHVQKDEFDYREFFELSLLYAKIPVSVDFLSTEILHAKSILRNIFFSFKEFVIVIFFLGKIIRENQLLYEASWGMP